MVDNIFKLYPQYNPQTDRRQNNVPVNLERRSGDRREASRLPIDSKLNQDINRSKDVFAAFKNDKDQFIKKVEKYDEVSKKSTFGKTKKLALAALSPIVPVRRISSLPDNIDDENYTRAVGLLGIMAFNLPEDCRDMRNSIRQISNKLLSAQSREKIKDRFPKFFETFIRYDKKYDYTKYQHPFSFFRGTWFEPLLELKGNIGEKLSGMLYKADKSLFDTKFGNYMQKLLNITEGEVTSSNIFDVKDEEVLAKSIKGGNKLTRIVGRGMLRMPVLGIYALSILELPALIKSLKKRETIKEKAESVAKQTTKSAVYVSAMSFGIGLIGALGHKKFGATGSLIGMGLGSVISGLLSKKAGEVIEKD
ncbi:MAG: hypothetical protein PHC34_00715 [Candidatus Gastranaerophilales bacterium]|nr:hypothetical protein [Candidatus Gastranaerophilales bacterium]